MTEVSVYANGPSPENQEDDEGLPSKEAKNHQAIAKHYHVLCGHSCISYLRSIAETVEGMEELLQLPSDFKMDPVSYTHLRAHET